MSQANEVNDGGARSIVFVLAGRFLSRADLELETITSSAVCEICHVRADMYCDSSDIVAYNIANFRSRWNSNGPPLGPNWRAVEDYRSEFCPMDPRLTL
jgi:hypothetical protein